ncbi:vWA domain-containing protein [Gynuella sp.]|uniref:vWA domain-containing protein n=1 Tax=Gynuella sp. TaxID=2969146 RepID=UPI003D152BE4
MLQKQKLPMFALCFLCSGMVLLGGCASKQESDASLQEEGANLQKMDAKMAYTMAAPEMVDMIGMPMPESSDSFTHADINPVKLVSAEPVSTFSADVDTASYSYIRRSLNNGRLPDKDSVRLEEMVNYFDYQYPLPKHPNKPFSVSTYVQDSPWAEGRQLIHIGVQGYELPETAKPHANLVFLLDVSGSMNEPDKLPLLKKSMQLLLSQLQDDDTVAIVVYAGAAGVVLPPTSADQKVAINQALKNLSAGGSTAGAEGIELAYQLAEEHFDKDGVNRIILATDGDFNVGLQSTQALKSYIERKRDRGIYLSILGFGRGNYRDDLMQTLAQNGNGIAAYIDTLSEARKVLVQEASSTLFPIATDLKLQIEFNPAQVREYRLLGYETRMLNREDFNNDKVDAGDIGSGHSVTAIYEITPVGSKAAMLDDLRYTPSAPISSDSGSDELAFIKLRYKLPGEDHSRLIEKAVKVNSNDDIATDAKFAASVAGFAQLLKDPRYLQQWNFEDAIKLALKNRGDDPYGYRSEFVQLIRAASTAAPM